ncbi:MAG: hypothetical protein JSV96_05885 [Candidatus Aminicenantes bacterium]|nr:MAG: hypothetical protein JSV96_05885 [Candidatus Aminicenantes bacterium]
MIHIDFDPGKLTGSLKDEWDQIQKESETAILESIKAYENAKAKKPDEKPKIEWKNEIWTKFKKWLSENIFNGKCAYCESSLGRQFPDAEHHRPKGGVNFRKNGDKLQVAVCEDERKKKILHPGYFWLAYNWKNLVPSCKVCNSGEGKGNQFPVKEKYVLLIKLSEDKISRLKAKPYPSKKWAGYYYLQPEDLDDIEKPFLLNPYRDKPHDHIRFGTKGIETHISEKGEHSIKVLKLNDDVLRQLRAAAQEKAMSSFLIAYANEVNMGEKPEGCLKKAWKTLNDFEQGKSVYSMAVLDFI